MFELIQKRLRFILKFRKSMIEEFQSFGATKHLDFNENELALDSSAT